MQKRTRKPPRFKQNDAIYFLTFCTFRRWRILHNRGIPEMLRANLLFYARRLTRVIAYTIMPDHIHLLVEVADVQRLSAFLRDFKKWTARELQKTTLVRGQPIWQRGTMDHCIREENDNRDLENHLQYLFGNSWKHLRIRPIDFPYHNFLEFVESGWYDEDFLGLEFENEFKLYKGGQE